jgi:hypothetical protein
MPQRATSRRRSRNIRGFGWLTEKKVTYRRDVGAERKRLKADAFEARKEALAVKKLRAEERIADAKIAEADRRIAAATKIIDTAEKKVERGGMSEARFDAMKARMQQEIEAQERHRAAAEAKLKNPCAVTRRRTVTDRAKRYRANQPGCKPGGVKKCKLCDAKRDLMVDHKDGNESNGRKSNLRWLCRSCNTLLGAEMARTGEGRRTVQYNPGGARTLGEYMSAVLQHTRGAHDEGGRIIHETPKRKRQEYASQIWSARKARGNPRSNWGFGVFAQDTRSAFLSNAQVAWFKRAKEAKAFAAEHNDALRASGEWHSQTKPHYHVRKAFQQTASGGSIPDYTPGVPNPSKGSTKSKGHLFFKDGQEWYQAGGEIYRAPTGNVIDVETGYSIGRWEFPVWQMEQRRARGVYPFDSATAANPSERAVNSIEYNLGYSLGQRDRETASLHRSAAELKENFLTKFDPAKASPGFFMGGYDAGYGQASAPAKNPLFGGTGSKMSGYDSREQEDREAVEYGEQMGRDAALAGRPKSRSLGIGTRGHISPRAVKLFKAAYSRAYDAAKKNPEPGADAGADSEYEQAQRIAELFHGRAVKEEITVTEMIREHDWLWKIGPLVSLKVKTLSKGTFEIPFHLTEEQMVHLLCSPDGRQFYLRGGDQELNLEAIGMGPKSDWYRDRMLIGEAKELTYQDKKKFHKFKLIDYYHKLGEVTKKKPMLAYDSLAKRLEIWGGQSRVETEDLVDGMSPGIVN